MKKILIIILLSVFCLNITGCGKKENFILDGTTSGGMRTLIGYEGSSKTVELNEDKISDEYRYRISQSFIDSLLLNKRVKNIKIDYPVKSINYLEIPEDAKINMEWENGVLYLDDWAIDYKDDLEVLEFREGTKGIMDRISKRHLNVTKKVKTIIIPGSVKRVPFEAFIQLPSLTTVIIKEGVEELGERAFYKCENLKKVDLPEGLKKIGYKCFKASINLKEIFIPKSIINYGLNGDIVYAEKIYCEIPGDGIPGSINYIYPNGEIFSNWIDDEYRQDYKVIWNANRSMMEGK